jgi:hypothetical protein
MPTPVLPVANQVPRADNSSLLPNLIGGRQCRAIALQGDRLVLRTSGGPVTGTVNVTSRLEWERITGNSARSM